MSRRMSVLALTVAVVATLSALTAATAGARQSAAYKAASGAVTLRMQLY